jgi:hypothetical protein
MKRPLLKFACTVSGGVVRYRGIEVAVSPQTEAVLPFLGGRASEAEVERLSGVSLSCWRDDLARLQDQACLLEGEEILREDGLYSGREIFWRLEALLLTWRSQALAEADALQLDREIFFGRAPLQVVKGFCLEQGHLLRAVPEELALAIANAPDEQIRLEYMTFYDEESRHGEILLQPLIGWLGSGHDIRMAPPLPTTTGLIQTYRNWARKDPLLYAVALMRDEGTPLDAPPAFDVYEGMRRHYDVPESVVERFEWHANLDRQNDHGFFAERIFSQFPILDNARVERLIGTLRDIVDLHDAFRAGVYRYYSRHDIQTRCGLSSHVLSDWSRAKAGLANAARSAVSIHN